MTDKRGPAIYPRRLRDQAQALADRIGGHLIDWGASSLVVVSPDRQPGPNWQATRTTDPETSRQAARGVKTDTDRALALAAHADHPDGLTDFELGDLIGRKQTSAGKRRLELCRTGLVEATDITRPSDTGSNAVVWRITDAGRIEAARLRKEAA